MATITLKEFQRLIERAVKTNLREKATEACEASAKMVGFRITRHIRADDLPLTALSPEWIAYKLSGGYPRNHLMYTGLYLRNMNHQPIRNGHEVGTNRPVKGQSGFNLPEFLEGNYPVWQLTLDEVQPIIESNALEGVKAGVLHTPARLISR